MKWLTAMGTALAIFVSGLTLAADPVATEHCVETTTGEIICPPPGGVVTVDVIGTVACGLGECRQNAIGQWVCSAEKGGHAGRDRIGQVLCTGGCRPPSQGLCETPPSVARPDVVTLAELLSSCWAAAATSRGLSRITYRQSAYRRTMATQAVQAIGRFP